ncbi:MAG: methylenetetrahydrofolate reductase [NAD(P)H] [Halobacteriovoraceae bacterium]|nr:methylenetetrahydrofolate reductase [NAD(P)H] [Halobacteriovoraceae bacterium]
MAKIIDYFNESKETLYSIEILPPLKGESIKGLFERIMPLMELKPKFIDVTYHREEYVYKQKPNGFLEKRVVKKRPGTVGICAALMNKFHVETVPHIICGGFSREETENALIDLDFLGITNVLALRGDAIKNEPRFRAEPDGHNYASDLIEQIVDMNNGRYLDEDLKQCTRTNFCIGVAGYPEKHFEAPNLNIDLNHLKKKIDLGADYIVTQMFFDNKKYFDFVKSCRDVGIKVPIIPGLKPISTIKQLTTLPSFFHIDIPDDLAKEVSRCKNNEDVMQVGIKWCIQQSKELMENNVPCLHYYSMGRADPVISVARELF